MNKRTTNETGDNLMTKDEMLRRIADGESKVAISLDKWKRIKSYLGKNKPDPWYGFFSTYCEGGTCALCQEQPCGSCLMKIDGLICADREHPWMMLRQTGEVQYVDQIIKHLKSLGAI